MRLALGRRAGACLLACWKRGTDRSPRQRLTSSPSPHLIFLHWPAAALLCRLAPQWARKHCRSCLKARAGVLGQRGRGVQLSPPMMGRFLLGWRLRCKRFP